MKSRRVIVTLEVETDAPLSDLRNRKLWRHAYWGAIDADGTNAVRQVHANVVKPDRRPCVPNQSTNQQP